MTASNRSQNRTWIFDIDGVVFPHNGYLKKKNTEWETALPGVREVFDGIDKDDFIIFLTSRSIDYKDITYRSLLKNGLRHNLVVFGLPTGARILFNDLKPDGTKTAFAFNVERDKFLSVFNINDFSRTIAEV